MYKAILYIGIEVSKKYVEDKNVAYMLHRIVSNNNRIAGDNIILCFKLHYRVIETIVTKHHGTGLKTR